MSYQQEIVGLLFGASCMYSLYSAILYSPVTNMNVVLCTTSDTDDDFGHCSFLFVFLNFLFG